MSDQERAVIERLDRVADALERRNALARARLQVDLEADPKYASNPDVLQRNIREMERKHLREREGDQ